MSDINRIEMSVHVQCNYDLPWPTIEPPTYALSSNTLRMRHQPRHTMTHSTFKVKHLLHVYELAARCTCG